MKTQMPGDIFLQHIIKCLNKWNYGPTLQELTGNFSDCCGFVTKWEVNIKWRAVIFAWSCSGSVFIEFVLSFAQSRFLVLCLRSLYWFFLIMTTRLCIDIIMSCNRDIFFHSCVCVPSLLLTANEWHLTILWLFVSLNSFSLEQLLHLGLNT